MLGERCDERSGSFPSARFGGEPDRPLGWRLEEILMMNGMMSGGMMWGMGLLGLLGVVLAVLAIAALVKYIFFR